MIIVRNIRLKIGQTENDAIMQGKKLLRDYGDKINKAFLYKVSVDARYDTPFFVYSIAFKLGLDEKMLVLNLKNSDIIFKDDEVLSPIYRAKHKVNSPVIVGFGPAGMFCALELAKNGHNPIVIERGDSVDIRETKIMDFLKNAKLDTSSNIQFGEGGAGAFSDGKLTTRINDKYCDYVLNQFHKYGADEDILYNAKPHIGSDVLLKIVRNIRNEIISLGGKVLFNTTLTGFKTSNNKITKAITSNGSFDTDCLILAIGHSARDTYEMLNKEQIKMTSKAFSVGFRVEHQQSFINQLFYKKFAEDKRLPPASYQLSFTKGQHGVYSFCMCPGGVVVPATSEENMVVTNGMSYKSRDLENANSAIVASVSENEFGSDLFGGMNFQRELEKKAFILGGENYNAPIQTAKDFINGEKTTKIGAVSASYKPGTTLSILNDIYPTSITSSLVKAMRVFDASHKGFSDENAILTGVETRTSSPIRITRDENYQTNIEGIYPIGEGSGYAGGIMSSIVDAIKFLVTILN
ncbi:MAG: hypothetical protein RR436_01475 [Clostridia bacterium]